MSEIRQKIERLYEAFGLTMIRHCRWVIAVVFFSFTMLVSQLPTITFDTSTEGFLEKDDSAISDYNSFRDQFGRDEVIIIMLEPKKLYSLEFLKKLRQLHGELEENVPYLNSINSLVNARLTQGAEGELLVKDLLEKLPTTNQELAQLQTAIQNNPLYQNLIISSDGTFTAIAIKTEAFSSQGTEINDENFSIEFEDESERIPLTDIENTELIQSVETIISRYRSEELKITLSGSPVIQVFLKKAMQTDMKKFSALSLGLIGLFLFLIFHRASGVFIPLLIVIMSVLSTISLMAVFGVAIKTPTMVLPSFLMAVSVGASVHLLSIFYGHFKEHSKEDSILHAVSHSGFPITMTSLTTAAGLASFSTAEVAPIKDLGVMAACGVGISLLLTLTLVPSLLSLLKIKSTVRRKKQNKPFFLMDRILVFCGDLGSDHPKKVILSSFMLLGIAAGGITQLKVSHDVLNWFPEHSTIYQNTKRIDYHLKGSVAIEAVIKTEKENGLYDPSILKGIDQLAIEAKNYVTEENKRLVGKTVGLPDMLKEIHQALNEDRPDYYVIPKNKQLIAQEFLLFENSGSDDLEDIVDSQFKTSHLTIKAPWLDALVYVRMIQKLQEKANTIFEEKVKITFTGLITIMMQTISALIQSMISSYLIAGVLITFLMILLIGKPQLGLLSMVPNLAPIIITLGMMGWLGIQFDMFTLLIGSIAIGLAVDDTIHFFYHFRRFLEKTGDAKLAVEKTLLTTGRAMLTTTLVLTAGFWLFMLATLNNVFYFGLLTGLTLLLAFLADVILAPALLTVATRSHKTSHVNQKI